MLLFSPENFSQAFPLLLLLTALGLEGCASNAASTETPKSAMASQVTHSDFVEVAAGGQKPAGLEKLTQLWQKRTKEGSASDYPIGPGDVL